MDGAEWVQDKTGPPAAEPCAQCGAGPVRPVQYREKFAIGSFRYAVQCEQCGWAEDIDADHAARLFSGRRTRAVAGEPATGGASSGRSAVVAIAAVVALAVAGAVMFVLLSGVSGDGPPSVVGTTPEPLAPPPPPVAEDVTAGDPGAAEDPTAGDSVAAGDLPAFDADFLLTDFRVGPGGTLSAFDAPVGACMQRSSLRAGAVGPADVVSCSEPHDYQVFAAGQPEGWPGSQGLDAGWVFCWEAFEQLLGVDAATRYLPWPVVPTPERWAEGVRDVSCILESAMLRPLTESALPR